MLLSRSSSSSPVTCEFSPQIRASPAELAFGGGPGVRARGVDAARPKKGTARCRPERDHIHRPDGNRRARESAVRQTGEQTPRVHHLNRWPRPASTRFQYGTRVRHVTRLFLSRSCAFTRASSADGREVVLADAPVPRERASIPYFSQSSLFIASDSY